MGADAWGLDEGYHDAGGTWRVPPAETIAALRTAMGADEHPDRPPPGPPLWFVEEGEAPALGRPGRLTLEDGTELAPGSALPADLPLGYHDLTPDDGGPTTRVIVHPRRCHLPAELRSWGWTVQLYGARSAGSWGMGDLADLRRLARWSADHGAGVLAVNPLHAALPLDEQQPSPYFPSSRRFRNPLYLRIEEVPGAAEIGADLDELAAAGRRLNGDPRIDRDAIWTLKRSALELTWVRFGGDPSFDAYRRAHGTSLETYATFCSLAEHHGTAWPDWPAEHRHPDQPEVATWATGHADRVRFHAWLQWRLDDQLARAGDGLDLVGDLAIGVDPGGADAWAWQDVLAPGVRVGAPPDDFNTQGQDWGLPPFVPWKLRAARYEPFVETLRAGFAHAGGLRIDHVMGLFRLFWIPPGADAVDGAYVRFAADEMLALVALESVRAGALVVGEDLGTVESGVRETLAERGVLSYRLVLFEPEPPETFPAQALAAVTTHDLPTVTGLLSGSDLADQRAIGLDPNEDGTAQLADRLTAVAGVREEDDVTVELHRRLGRSPSMLVSGTLDDALGVPERPNMPGTTDEWPNWSIPLPKPLEEILADPEVEAISAALGRTRLGS